MYRGGGRGSIGLENIPKNNFLTASLMELRISSEFLFKIEITMWLENTEMTVVGEVFCLWDPLSQHNIESLIATGRVFANKHFLIC